MKPLKELEKEYDYRRTLETQNGNEANRLENCVLCVKTKLRKECGSDCPYFVK